jgi:type IV secretory pathway VirB4 component
MIAILFYTLIALGMFAGFMLVFAGKRGNAGNPQKDSQEHSFIEQLPYIDLYEIGNDNATLITDKGDAVVGFDATEFAHYEPTSDSITESFEHLRMFLKSAQNGTSAQFYLVRLPAEPVSLLAKELDSQLAVGNKQLAIDCILQTDDCKLHTLNSKLLKYREDFLNNKPALETSLYIFFTLPLNLKGKTGQKTIFAKKIEKIREEEIKDVERIVKEFTNSVSSNFPSMKPLNSNDTLNFLYLFLNNDENKHFSLQNINDTTPNTNLFIKPKHLAFNYKFHRILSLKSTQQQISAEFNDYLLYFQHPMIVCGTLSVLDQQKETSTLERKKNIAFTLISLRAKDVKQKVNLDKATDSLTEIYDKNELITSVSYNVVLWGKTPQETDMIVERFKGLANKKGLRFFDEDFGQYTVFLSLLPGQKDNPRKEKYLLSPSVAMMPFFTTPQQKEGSMILYNRYGERIRLDPFRKSASNWNSLVGGSAGKGKSFFAGNLLMQYLSHDPDIFVITTKGWEWMAESLNSDYVNIDANFGINLFGDGFLDDDKLNFLTISIGKLVMEKDNEAPTKSEQVMIEKAIKEMYGRETGRQGAGEQGRKGDSCPLSLITLAEIFKRDYPKFAETLKLYTEGNRAKFFVSNDKLQSDKRYVVYNLGGLKNYTDLMSITALQIMDKVWTRVKKNKGTEKKTIVVIDECWELLMNPAFGSFIEGMYRKFREFGGSVMAISQGFKEYTKYPGIIENTEFIYILQNKDDDEILKFIGAQEEELPAIRSLRSIKGKFSEIFTITPSFRDVSQLYPSQFDYWLTTSDPYDKQELSKLQGSAVEKAEQKIAKSKE